MQKDGSVIVAARKPKAALDVSPGTLLGALVVLGAAVGIFATTTKGNVNPDEIKLPPVQSVVPGREAEPVTMAERFNFLVRTAAASLNGYLQTRLGQ